MGCEHGYDGSMEASADEEERSSCCGAYVTFSGDGELYCKCCYAFISGGIEVEAIEVRVHGNPC